MISLRRYEEWVLAALTVIFSSVPALAQLDRVVAEAHPGDINCPTCALIIELNLKKVEGVNKVAVSMSKQRVAITFKQGARFKPKEYRDAILKAEVRVDSFHAAMRGKVEKEDHKLYFSTGRDRFLIRNAPKDLLTGTPVGIMATVDDSTEPYSILSIDDIQPL